MRPLAQALIGLAMHFAFLAPATASDRVELAELAGSWHGLYTYVSRTIRPVEFTMRLQVSANRCRGRTEEPNTFGDRSAPRLYANFDCELVIGRGPPRLVFRKVYDGTGGQSHGVDYDGEIASDRGGITGTWKIGTETGRFSLLKQ